MTDALTGKIHTLDFDNDKISVLDCFLCWQSEAHMAPGSRTVVLLYLMSSSFFLLLDDHRDFDLCLNHDFEGTLHDCVLAHHKGSKVFDCRYHFRCDHLPDELQNLELVL